MFKINMVEGMDINTYVFMSMFTSMRMHFCIHSQILYVCLCYLIYLDLKQMDLNGMYGKHRYVFIYFCIFIFICLYFSIFFVCVYGNVYGYKACMPLNVI